MNGFLPIFYPVIFNESWINTCALYPLNHPGLGDIQDGYQQQAASSFAVMSHSEKVISLLKFVFDLYVSLGSLFQRSASIYGRINLRLYLFVQSEILLLQIPDLMSIVTAG